MAEGLKPDFNFVAGEDSLENIRRIKEMERLGANAASRKRALFDAHREQMSKRIEEEKAIQSIAVQSVGEQLRTQRSTVDNTAEPQP